MKIYLQLIGLSLTILISDKQLLIKNIKIEAFQF
jgi:hypothetical protein